MVTWSCFVCVFFSFVVVLWWVFVVVVVVGGGWCGFLGRAFPGGLGACSFPARGACQLFLENNHVAVQVSLSTILGS